MRFVLGIVLGVVLTAGGFMLAGQPEREMHPRIARAIDCLRDARAYLAEAPHDFGGHKAAALRATDDAIRQLDLAMHYRAREDRR